MVINQTGRTFFALGTFNAIYTFGNGSERAVAAAMERVLQIHGRMSAFQEDSDIGRLNAAAGIGAVPVHPETASLLLLAQKCARLTNGAFDITLLPLTALWSVGKRGSFIPLASQIQDALGLAGIGDLKIDPETSSAFLPRPGMSVDLGGIAKGYAGDEVKKILLEQGVSSALINLGGNIITVGEHPEGHPWKIGIQNPLLPRGESLAILDIRSQSVVTSGAGERFFIKNGKRYHHILDPRTGMPAQSGLLSATVVSPLGSAADALATAFFILGPEEASALVRRDPEGFFSANEVQALFVSENLHLSATPGLSTVPCTSKEVH